MKRVSLDAQAREVKRFFQSLPIESEGVELEINGHVVCQVIPSPQFSDKEKDDLIRTRWELIRTAQRRNQGVSARVLERDVQDAVEEVRRRKRP